LRNVIIHIFLGALITQFKWIALFYFIFIFLKWAYNNNSNFISLKALIGIIGICGFEFIGRLSDMDPLIPYELSKYLLLFYSVGFIFSGRYKINKFEQILMAFLILSTFVYPFFYKINNNISRIVADGSGLFIFVVYTGFLKNVKTHISINFIDELLRDWFQYILMGLVFIFIKTPELDKISYNLGANYEATGGESANQVSTYLSLGIIIAAYFWIKNKYLTGSRIYDGILILGFVFQSLLTFSRGGIIVASIVSIYLLWKFNKIKFSRFNFGLIILLAGIIGLTVNYLNQKTGGMLSKRFAGETEATILGKKEKNIDVITSNRTKIIEENFEIFKQNKFGIGTSNGTIYRTQKFGSKYYDHTEPSRWLVEYGVFSILFFIGILKTSLLVFKRNDTYAYLSVALLLVSALTMMHSATRTFVSFVPFILSVIKIKK
jgi:hypothetical protein